MIRIVRRVQALTVLVLLLSGLLQPIAAARGVTCFRTHAPAGAVQQARGSTLEAGSAADVVTSSGVVDGDHRHSRDSRPEDPRAPSAPCGVAAVPGDPGTLSHTAVARQLALRGDQIPASVLPEPLFRPPRLS